MYISQGGNITGGEYTIRYPQYVLALPRKRVEARWIRCRRLNIPDYKSDTPLTWQHNYKMDACWLNMFRPVDLLK